jgi:hypothetical protein
MEIKGCNVARMQEAILELGDIEQIAVFGCFVRGADKELIERVIAEVRSPKAAYLYLRFVKFCNINRLKPIIMKSKRPRYLYTLARLIKNKKELELIEELIIRSKSMLYVRLFGQHIKGANINKLEAAVIESQNVESMKKFNSVIKSPRIDKLMLLL